MNKHVLSALSTMAAASLTSPTAPHPTQAQVDPWKRHQRGGRGHIAPLAKRLGGKTRERRSR